MAQPALDSKNSTATIAQIPTASPLSRRQTGQQITLKDRTRPGEPETTHLVEYSDDEDSALESGSLSRRWTKNSLQRRMASRRYGRYREDQFIGPDDAESATEDVADGQQDGRMRRGKNKVWGLLKTKKQMQQAREEDAVIDVLYENQRGWWFFGVPHFSSKTLLNFDPTPWLNGHKKPSPVNIVNAQVPEPSWEWAWDSWYVDMSRDVDEEGWEYSFWFSEGTSWHGTHPWGHSWVRRRRWLRKRVRKGLPLTHGRTKSSHVLSSEYFTLHPPKDPIRANSLALSSVWKPSTSLTGEFSEHQANVPDIGTLMAALRKATVDRQKLVLVRTFIDQGGEELSCLDEQMEHIMALCVFQNSRRQILSMLMDKFEAAQQHRKEHEEHGEEEPASEQGKMENLTKAIAAADDQVKMLEHWSDLRNMAREGKTLGATDDSNGWSSHEWLGLDNSGPEADIGTTAKEPGRSRKEIKKEAESQLRPKDSGFGLEMGKGEKPKLRGHLPDTSEEEAAYTTAEETTTYTAVEEKQKVDKGKGRAV